jgi:hypothetical protein
MPTTYPTQSNLQTLLGKHISQICTRGYSANSDNHCAHFVSHVLGLNAGATCATMTSGSGVSASIRVHEIFSRCPTIGAWSSLSPTTFCGLVFITNASNVNLGTRTMTNIPRKHVGIFLGVVPQIWHYSNSKRKVVRQTPEEFSHHYASPDNAMFWGSLP